jgi:hypothetical protein
MMESSLPALGHAASQICSAAEHSALVFAAQQQLLSSQQQRAHSVQQLSSQRIDFKPEHTHLLTTALGSSRSTCGLLIRSSLVSW